jgi:hypothetical protein
VGTARGTKTVLSRHDLVTDLRVRAVMMRPAVVAAGALGLILDVAEAHSEPRPCIAVVDDGSAKSIRNTRARIDESFGIYRRLSPLAGMF